MRRFFTLVACATLLGMSSLQAQQIRGDFDVQTEWGPETALGSTFKGIGIEPAGWSALNVTQMGMKFPLVFESEGRNGSGKSIKLMNRKLGAYGIGANSPSYITLGETWVYADIAGVISQLGGGDDPDDSDGGSIGGIDFTFRPDSIVGYYKRVHAEQNPNEVAQIIVYSWNGTCTSQSPIGDGMDLTENLEKVDLVDRDVDILGVKNNNQPATGIELVGKAIYSMENDLNFWKRVAVPIDYLSDKAPAKLNVIISAADYFNRPNIGAENVLYADDVRFIYNSKLKSLTVGGEAVAGFDEDVFEYTLPLASKEAEIAAVAYGKDATVQVGDVSTSSDGKLTRTITVNCPTSAGEKQYVYTISFKGEATVINLPAEAPVLTYGDEVESLGFTTNDQTVPVQYKSSDENILVFDVTAGKFKAVGAGTISIVASQPGSDNYAGTVAAPYSVTVAPAKLMVSMKDAWCERGVDFTNANKGKGKCGYELEYSGFKYEDTEEVLTAPVTVEGVAGAEAEKVGERRAATLSGATADNYTIEYAAEQSLEIKKTKLTVTAMYANQKISNSKKEIIIPVGLEKCPLRLQYSGFVYAENETKLANLPIIDCKINKEAAVGTQFPVTLILPKAGDENYEFVSGIPEGVVVTVKEAPELTLAKETVEAAYGDTEIVPVQVTATEGVVWGMTALNSNIASAKKNSTDGTVDVTVKNAGVAQVVVFIAPAKVGSDDEAKDYAGIEKIITVNVAKAPLAVAANPAARKVGEENPEFTYTCTGFVNGNEEKELSEIFTVLPSLTCVADAESPIGYYDITLAEVEAPNYEVEYTPAVMAIVPATDIDNVGVDNVQVYSADGAIIVEGNDEATPVNVYTVQGTLVYSGADTAIRSNIEANTIYIVKVGSSVTRVLVR